ncbi:MAG: uroporphyrinogen decarboxylase [Dermatophilaceae bacterium]
MTPTHPALPATHPALPATHPMLTGLTTHSPLIQAYRGKRTHRRPIWMMRQAGRSLPEYRAAREGIAMLDSCLRPDLAAEITCQPVRRHGVDAGIFFSDIVVPLRLAGVGVEIVPGVGPVMDSPLRSAADIDALAELDPAALAPITEAVGLTVAELGSTPLIGFAGAPFTVASYLIEGRPSRDYVHVKALMRDAPDDWHRLLGWVARTTGAFLRAQALAGASALQLFDSWAGALTPQEYAASSAPHSAAVLAEVADLGLPRVHFGTRTGPLLAQMQAAGADVMGVDAQTRLADANALFNGRVPLQGNIDPALLAAPWPELARHTLEVLADGQAAPGHVVNLGHGVPPTTDPDVLTQLVELVHEHTDPDGPDAPEAEHP